MERESCFGGTTALSGGWLWIPCNPPAQRAGVAYSIEQAHAYLRHELGERYNHARIDAFLEAGPRMVEFFELETAVRFMLGADYPDYHPDQRGWTRRGAQFARNPSTAVCSAPAWPNCGRRHAK